MSKGHNTKTIGIKKCDIAVIVPGKPSGGVKQVIAKFIKGLNLEGLCVETIALHSNIFISNVYDLKNIKTLRERFKIVIYMGSTPWPSHVFVGGCTRALLFIHGYVKYEYLFSIKHGNLKVKLGMIPRYLIWQSAMALKKIDRFICHSVTLCEINGVQENHIILPQFVLPHEVEFFEAFYRRVRELKNSDDTVVISTYTSHALSPRLLSSQDIEHLARIVSRYTNKKIVLIVVNPRARNEIVKSIGNLMIKHVSSLPRIEFLETIVNSDLFIECNIDEELRLSSLEAALLHVPLAKLTHPIFKDRCDYKGVELIHAYSFKELVNKIVEYINNMEYYKEIYSKRMLNFVLNHRTWNAVKKPLMDYLQKVMVDS